MAEYFRVSPRIWLEPYSDDVRMLAFYLLTCRHRKVAGIYLLPLAYAADDLRWEMPRLRSCLELLISDEFCSYDEQSRVVFIHKALSYQAPVNPKQATHYIKTTDDLPDTPLLADFVKAAKELCTEGYQKTFAADLEEHLKDRISTPIQEPLPIPFAKPLPIPSSISTPTPTPTPTRKKRDSGESLTLSNVPFEELWKTTGRIGSKDDARLAYLWWTGKGTSADDLLTACLRYYEHCDRTDTPKKHLSTFLAHRNRERQSVNRWQEWLTEEHGSGNGRPRSRSASQRVLESLARDEPLFEPRQIGAP